MGGLVMPLLNPLLAVEANLIGTDIIFRAAKAMGTIVRATHFLSPAVPNRGERQT